MHAHTKRRPWAPLVPRLALLVLATAYLSAAAASAATLTLSDGPYNTWAVSGVDFDWGRTDVQVWVVDLTTHTWLEYQNGLKTTQPFCAGLRCVLPGRLHATGTVVWVPPGEFFGGYYVAVHPLACGHSYQAWAYDPVERWVVSNTLVEPNCPPPPR